MAQEQGPLDGGPGVMPTLAVVGGILFVYYQKRMGEGQAETCKKPL